MSDATEQLRRIADACERVADVQEERWEREKRIARAELALKTAKDAHARARGVRVTNDSHDIGWPTTAERAAEAAIERELNAARAGVPS